MRLTGRDVRLVRDVALSGYLTRAQSVKLGYFGSTTRANARLLTLVRAGFLVRHEAPYLRAHLYRAGPCAGDVLGEKVARAVASASRAPSFVRHALSVTEVRIALAGRGFMWRFEPQVTVAFRHAGRDLEVRPDGAGLAPGRVVLVEADMGNASLPRVAKKLDAYRAFAESGALRRSFGEAKAEILIATVGARRAASLAGIARPLTAIRARVGRFEDLGVVVPGYWA